MPASRITVLMPNHFQVLIRAMISIGSVSRDFQKTGACSTPASISQRCSGPLGLNRLSPIVIRTTVEVITGRK